MKTNIVIACAEFAYQPVQIDADITINKVPAVSFLHAITDELKSVSFRDHITFSSELLDKIGIEVPNDPPVEDIDLKAISMGSSNDIERTFVENLVLKYQSIISCSQWDLGVLSDTPAHISVKTGTIPHFSKQRMISDPEVRIVAAKMIAELKSRGLIKNSTSPWNSPLIILKKAPRVYKLGSVMSNNELCQIPGMKRSAWDSRQVLG